MKNSKSIFPLELDYSGNSQYRTIFCFDTERDIILLVGGNKSNVKRFYESIIPKAEQL